MTPISVVLPIGPEVHHGEYLGQAIRSIAQQSIAPHSLVIVDDMAYDWQWALPLDLPFKVYIVKNSWRLGVAASYNVGVGAAKTECVLLLGADDWLEPDCIEQCQASYEAYPHKSNTMFFLGVRYSDGREDQYLPCNASLVTKGLWEQTGGFPTEAGCGASDTMLSSIMWARQDGGQFHFKCVNPNKPLYNYRVHDLTDTAQRSEWQNVIWSTRELVTKLWTPPQWGRYS